MGGQASLNPGSHTTLSVFLLLPHSLFLQIWFLCVFLQKSLSLCLPPLLPSSLTFPPENGPSPLRCGKVTSRCVLASSYHSYPHGRGLPYCLVRKIQSRGRVLTGSRATRWTHRCVQGLQFSERPTLLSGGDLELGRVSLPVIVEVWSPNGGQLSGWVKYCTISTAPLTLSLGNISVSPKSPGQRSAVRAISSSHWDVLGLIIETFETVRCSKNSDFVFKSLTSSLSTLHLEKIIIKRLWPFSFG